MAPGDCKNDEYLYFLVAGVTVNNVQSIYYKLSFFRVV